MSGIVLQPQTMNDKDSPQLTTRKPRIAKVTVKLTDQEKRKLDKLAWDQDDSVSRIIRIALSKSHPEIFQR